MSTVDLQEGEELRTATGTARGTTLTSLPGTDRVYNFTVEADHVYDASDALNPSTQRQVHRSYAEGLMCSWR